MAKSDIGLGQTVTPEDMQWQTWPAATASNTFHPPQRTSRSDHPGCRRLDRARTVHRGRADPGAETGQGQRLGLHGGDPAHRHARHLDRNLAGDRRRRLHPAQRPGRRHSLKREKNAGRPDGVDVVNSEIILSNVRVLAIDQAPKEKDGQNAVVGKTVTLELKPEQAETLARARQTGTLSLALRSIADVNMVENGPTIRLQARRSINVVRYGIPSSTTTLK